jgi:hypothetical protein
MRTALIYTRTPLTCPPHNCVAHTHLNNRQCFFLPAWLRHNKYTSTTSAATTSHEHYIKNTALPKFWRHLGTLGMKAAAGSSGRLVIFLRNYTASHSGITDRPKTWPCINMTSHKLSLYGCHVWQLILGRNRRSSDIYPSLILEDWTDRLSRNVYKKLTLYPA